EKRNSGRNRVSLARGRDSADCSSSFDSPSVFLPSVLSVPLWFVSLGRVAVGQKIERDHQRFRKLVRGKVKSNLSKYISRGEMIGKKGKDLVSIPLPQIDIPQFRYGQKGSGGTGQGDGAPGTPLGPGQGDPQAGAGDQPGGHILEVDLTMEEMAQILGEELSLPRIQPRGKKNIVSTRDKYTGIRQAGPESLR